MKNTNLYLEDDDFFSGNENTPLKKDAFKLSNEEKKHKIEKHFAEIIDVLGLDLNDESIKDTPKRVAKMFVDELFWGLNPDLCPKATSFSNVYKYESMLIEKDISVFSTCEHHFLPIIGKAHVAYISSGQIIGLSKLNRIVDYFSRRPQVQERLTIQIVKKLQELLKTDNVACLIEAKHLCVTSRGIKDTSSSTITAHYGGVFKQNPTREELLRKLNLGL